MRQTRETEEVEEPTRARREGARLRSRSAGQAAWRGPTQRQTRRPRRMILTVSVLGALVGVVLVATLVGHFFLTNAQGLLPTPAGQLGITPGPTYPARQVQSTAERDLDRALDAYISQMTLDDELGQMVQAHFGVPGSEYPTIPANWLPVLQKYHVGSLILLWFNIQSKSQVQALTASVQAKDISPNIPMMIGIDEEGGDIDYLPDAGFPRGPSEWTLGGSGDPSKADPQGAYNWGIQAGQELKELGLNTAFAPVVDVGTGFYLAQDQRMYSDDPTVVTELASQFVNGLHSQGIISTLKHWPGMGWDTVDPHAALTHTSRSLADLEKTDFAPYKALIASGQVDMIMPTHIVYDALDPVRPASLSPILIDGVLRGQLGFQGVSVTDALWMGALGGYTGCYCIGERAVQAVLAGNDMIANFYNPQDLVDVITSLHAAVDSGRITKARVDLSVKRILTLKAKYHIWTPPGYNG